MDNNGLHTQEELEGMCSSDLILKLNVFWATQKEKAIEAETLMDECEKLEEQMIKIIGIMLEKDPEGYKEYLKSFGKEEEDVKSLDSQ